MRKRVVALAVLMTCLSQCGVLHAAGSGIKGQEAERESLNKKIRQYNELARQKDREGQTLLTQLDRLRRDASASQGRMEFLEKENSRLQVSMEELNRSIFDINKVLEGLLPRFRGRVLDLYKYSSQGSLDALLSIGNAHDALNTAYMLRCFIKQDQDIIAELAEQTEKLSLSRAKLEEDRAKVQSQTEELQRKRAEFNTTIKQTNALLKDIQAQKQKAVAAARELSAAQREIGNRINSANRKKTVNTPVGQSGQQRGQAPGAALEWPLRGLVTAQFGSRVHPVFKTKVFNSGIDIQAASGTPVRSAGSGEVMYTGWIRGFGQVIIVDHGRNVSTVYAHLASASVREGDAVRTGSIIGTVGNSGSDAGYGLHFEVRRNGSAQNPMNYLRKI